MLDIYGNMDPDYIDYTLIDPSLRGLVKAINYSSWARTIGSCAGRAHHKNKGGFYMIIEVKGMKGIRNLLRWLSLSHALGFKACHEVHSLKDFAIPTAEIVAPNLLHGDNSVSRPMMGNSWFKFQINLYNGERILTKEQTEGGIKALELGWDALANGRYPDSKKIKI
jgi:hypothetical protein